MRKKLKIMISILSIILILIILLVYIVLKVQEFFENEEKFETEQEIQKQMEYMDQLFNDYEMESNSEFEDIKTQGIVLKVDGNVIYTSTCMFLAPEGGYDLEEYEEMIIKTSDSTKFIDFSTLEPIKKENIKCDDIIIVEGKAKKNDHGTYIADFSEETIKILTKENFEKLTNEFIYQTNKIENVTLYNYGIVIENAINCKIKMRVVDGENIEHEIAFIKAFPITDETITENKPNEENNEKESIIDLEIRGSNTDDLEAIKIIYK